jgi:sterol desaturase/sphingolipid hydroxylase (fatty acid hydroxylase superfamily)
MVELVSRLARRARKGRGRQDRRLVFGKGLPARLGPMIDAAALADFGDRLGAAGPRLLAAVVDPFIDPYSRVGLLSIAAGVLFAALAYGLHVRPWGGPKAFLSWLAPRAVRSHASALVDLKIYLFTVAAKPAGLLLFGATVAGASGAAARLLTDAFGTRSAWLGSGPLAYAALTAALFVAFDLSTYITHRLSHEVPALWAFHRVHHSAEVLTPLTLLRKHPVYDALSGAMDIVLVAPLQGLILYLWGLETTNLAIGGLTVAFGAFSWAGGVLRHSHVWLSFGPVGDRIIVSPATHQIHHSTAVGHWNRNYGEVLAIWDVMFGTACLTPRTPEPLAFGLGDGRPQPHPNLVEAMVEPFRYAWRRAAQVRPAEPEVV